MITAYGDVENWIGIRYLKTLLSDKLRPDTDDNRPYNTAIRDVIAMLERYEYHIKEFQYKEKAPVRDVTPRGVAKTQIETLFRDLDDKRQV